MIMSTPSKDISFIIDGILFEYDEEKNRINIQKHGLSFETAARVFFDYDRLELYDEIHSTDEDRYNTIGDLNAGGMVIGSAPGSGTEIIFVVYTERQRHMTNGKESDVIRLISARVANSFERLTIKSQAQNEDTYELEKL